MSKQTYKNKICPLPFTQLSLHSSGKITPCCHLIDYELGNINQNSISEIWNCDKLRKLRTEFLEGEIVTCHRRIFEIHCNFYHPDLDIHVEHKAIQTAPVKRLDLMLNGKCNLKCIMCDNWLQPNDVYNDDNFWLYSTEHVFPYLQEIEVHGGEPFIQKDVFRLIETVSKVNNKCQWVFTTNGQFVLSPQIKSYFDKVKLSSISVSIDSLHDETFAAIRKNGKLRKTISMLDDLIDYREKMTGDTFLIVLNVVIQKENWSELPTIIEFCRKRGIKTFPYFLTTPSSLSLNSCTPQEKEKILEFYIEKNKTLKSIILLNFICQMLKTRKDKNSKDLLFDFANHYLSMASEFQI